MTAPLRERRQALEHLLTGERLILPVRRLNPSGLLAWQEVLRAGYEGMVAQDPESPYVPGRTLKWLKVKQPDYRVERGGSLDCATSTPRATGYNKARARSERRPRHRCHTRSR